MTLYGEWEYTPRILQIIGFHPKRRRRWASWMIGGGFDGWEYFDARDPASPNETNLSTLSPSVQP